MIKSALSFLSLSIPIAAWYYQVDSVPKLIAFLVDRVLISFGDDSI